MSRARNGPTWPFWIWSIQFLPATLVFAYGAWRLSVGVEAGFSVASSLLALLVGTLWIALATLTLAFARGRRWVVERRREWLLSVSSVLVTVLLFDVILTLTGTVRTVAEQRKRSISYTMSRFTSYRLVPQEIEGPDGGTIKINERGFRGPEIAPIKAPGRVRIAFVGGSQVFDYNGADWPRLTAAKLRESGYDVEAVNAGVPGYNSTDALAVLLTDLWVLQPDIIFACHSWNDFKFFRRVGPGAPYRGLPPQKPLPWLLDWRIYPTGLDRVLTASAIYRHFRWGFVQFLFTEEGFDVYSAFTRKAGDLSIPVSESWGPRQFALNLELMANLARQIGAELVLCKQAYRREGRTLSGIDAHVYARRNLGYMPAERDHAYDLCNRVIAEVSGRHGILVVDMDGALSSRAEYFWDAVHFSPEGSHAAAAVVASALQDTVRKVKAAAGR